MICRETFIFVDEHLLFALSMLTFLFFFEKKLKFRFFSPKKEGLPAWAALLWLSQNTERLFVHHLAVERDNPVLVPCLGRNPQGRDAGLDLGLVQDSSVQVDKGKRT